MYHIIVVAATFMIMQPLSVSELIPSRFKVSHAARGIGKAYLQHNRRVPRFSPVEPPVGSHLKGLLLKRPPTSYHSETEV
jgi:hypothetical protein